MISDKVAVPKYTRIRETYTVDSLLGAGAFGAVYKVRHKYLGFQALKIFHPGSIPKEQENELFNEAYILSKLTHENVVRVYEANTFTMNDKRYCYIAMEYVDGIPLDKYLEREVKVSVDLALEIQKGICAGLAQAHSLEPPVVHRDVKPQNVMMALKGSKFIVKVSDFGLAQHVDPITRLAEAAGTLAYLPPEGFWNYESPASDVFSAGIILYIMLTGIAPFKLMTNQKYTQKNEIQTAIKESRNRLPDRPSKYADALDQELEEIVLKSLSPDIKKRYPNASAMLDALSQYLQSLQYRSNESIQRALQLGKQYNTIANAITLLEDAISKQPKDQKEKLSKKYEDILNHWKRGIVM